MMMELVIAVVVDGGRHLEVLWPGRLVHAVWHEVRGWLQLVLVDYET